MGHQLHILTNLNDQFQVGGANLRIKALLQIYESLGIDSRCYYLSDFQRKQTFRGLWNTIKFHTDVRPLFRTSRLELPAKSWLQLESIEYLNWKLPSDLSGIILDVHNLEHELYFDRLDRKNSDGFADLESELMEQVNIVLFCSERERQKVGVKRPQIIGKSLVIPNLVNRENYQVSTKKEYISFIGSLNYYPNEQAALFIVNKLYPTLSKELKSKFKFVIAGKNPSPKLVRAFSNQEGVELKADLPYEQMMELYSQTFLSLVPLQSGSGTRLKVAEAIFSGNYVLSTPIGSEGFTSPLIINCPLNEFPSEIEKLSKLPPLRKDSQEIDNFAPQADIAHWLKNNRDEIQHVFKQAGFLT